MPNEDRYWIVRMDAFAFDSKEEACRFRDALMDAFTAMPEAEGYGSSSRVIEEVDSDADA